MALLHSEGLFTHNCCSAHCQSQLLQTEQAIVKILCTNRLFLWWLVSEVRNVLESPAMSLESLSSILSNTHLVTSRMRNL